MDTHRDRFAGGYERLCAVQGCLISYGSVKDENNGELHQFFSFPKEIRRRELWARAAKPHWPHWTPKPTDCICDRHFTPAEVLDCPSLMNGADPHLNIPAPITGDNSTTVVDSTGKRVSNETVDVNYEHVRQYVIRDSNEQKDTDQGLLPQHYYCCRSEIPEMRRRVCMMEKDVTTLFQLLRNLLHSQPSVSKIDRRKPNHTPPHIIYNIGEAPREGCRALKRMQPADSSESDEKPTLPVTRKKSRFATKSMVNLKSNEINKCKPSKLYACPKCEAMFEFRSYLTNHLKKHAKDPPAGLSLTCEHCSLTLRSEAARLQHYLAEHGFARMLCRQCGQSFERRKRLIRHMLTKHGIAMDEDDDGIQQQLNDKEQDDSMMYEESGVDVSNDGCFATNESDKVDSSPIAELLYDAPTMDCESATLHNPISGDELTEDEVILFLSKALLLLQTHSITKQKFRMLGPDWIQLVDDADIVKAVDLLCRQGLLTADTDVPGTSGIGKRMSKGVLLYHKALPERVNRLALSRLGVDIDAYSATFAR